MAGLDASDFIQFMRLTGREPLEIAIRTAEFIGRNQDQINTWNAIGDAAATDQEREGFEVSHRRSIERREALLVRLKMPDSWGYWPHYPDDELHSCRAYVAYGYWQGFFEEPSVRLPLATRQWAGESIAATVEAFGFPVLRERFAIWSMANFWRLVARDFLGGRLPGHFGEVCQILSDDWWNENLRGIAWGGGTGLPISEPEKRLHALRSAGHSWQSAADRVYADKQLGAMIAACLTKQEARRQKINYGLSWREWPPVVIH